MKNVKVNLTVRDEILIFDNLNKLCKKYILC